MEVVNDNTCSWINDLTPRTNIKSIESNEDCEYLVVGAGYTGLSAVMKLRELHPNQKLIIVDAQLALSLIHISEPTRPRLISYAVFCLKKKKCNMRLL